MSRRTFLQQLVAAVALVCILLCATPAWSQGNSAAAFERVKEVQERHIEVLMSKLGVVGTGIGYDDDGELAIKVFTESSDVPGIPRALENVRVETVVSGQFVARADPTAWFPRPVPIGVSTGHPMITAGTIGCRVTDGTNVYALSNNHVYANQNLAKSGDAVIQPGTYDGGTSPSDDIGTLAAFETIYFDGTSNYIDAAIALCSTATLGTATPSDGYGTPSSTLAEAQLGMRVKKYGRTTGLTTGKIYALNATVNVGYDVGTAKFVDQIIITPGSFSDGGDSGSLIVTREGNNPVGLLFAGSVFYTIANPIDDVLSHFGVSVDDSPSSPPPSNNPPAASFTYAVDGLSVSFNDTSTDLDGTIASWSWNFGDGATSTAQNPSHTYASSGTYPVSLTVTDSGGATDTASRSVTVDDQQGDNPYSVAITGSGTNERNAGKNVFVSAFATIHVRLGAADAGDVPVVAEWSGAVSGQSSGYTDGSGLVTLYSPEVKAKNSDLTFNVQVSSVDGYPVTGVDASVPWTAPSK